MTAVKLSSKKLVNDLLNSPLKTSYKQNRFRERSSGGFSICDAAAMTSYEVSSLNGLPYKKESYFDFVVADPPPRYTPGSGPPLAPISVLPPHDRDGFIVERTLVAGELRYVVCYEDSPHLTVSVRVQNILDWVSRRTLEQWESEEYERYLQERMELEMPAILAKEQAKRKRLERISRGEGGRKVDGRRKRKIREVGSSRERAVDDMGPQKRRKPGRLSRSRLSIANMASSTEPADGEDEDELRTYISPRRLSQQSQPSLSTPRSRGIAGVIVLDSDESDDDSTDVDRQLKAQLDAASNLSESEESIHPLTDSGNAPSSLSQHSPKAKSLGLTRDPSSEKSTPRRASFIGGMSSTAATSSREAFSIYESIEQKSKRGSSDAVVMLDRSPFKKTPSIPTTQHNVKLPGKMLPPRSTRSSSRQDTPSSQGSIRKSERKP